MDAGQKTVGPNMASAKEFREYADDCLDLAKTVCSDRERAIFLDMARNWLEAASRAEGRKVIYQPVAKRPELAVAD